MILQANRKFKYIFSVFLSVAVFICFTFNTFAVDMTSITQDPQIIIDGRDSEFSWTESNRVVFTASPQIGGLSSVDMLHYKNTIYGAVNFNGVFEEENDFILRIDFHYKKSSAYVIFVMQQELILCSEGDFNSEGMGQKTEMGYCAEFSFSSEYNMFEQGDLVQVEIRYGTTDEVECYENVYGFMGREIYDYYIGGQLMENVEVEKTTKLHNNNNSNSKTTTAKTTVTNITTKSSNFDLSNNNNLNSISDVNFLNNKETEVIIIVMAVTCVVVVAISVAIRKPSENKKDNNYTDEDKGCD